MIETKSVFYYGIVIDENTKVIPFSEGASEILAELRVGSYTHTDFANEIAVALNKVSNNNYVVSLDRNTRELTISADSNFELLCNSSLLTGVSAFPIMGFEQLSDKTGSNSYISDFGSGKEYKPQYYLQSYVPFINSQKASSASVNVSATGITEVIQYGKNLFMSCNIKFATNSVSDSCFSSFIDNNPTGYDDLLDFMEYCTTKSELEFMPDIADRNAFDKCILESASGSSDGTGFDLRELLKDGLKNHYETGLIKFRKV